MTLLRGPAVVLDVDECAWVAEVLGELLRRGDLARYPGLEARAAQLVDTLRQVSDDERRNCRPALLSKGEAARLLCVSVRTLERRIAAGDIEVVRVGGAVRLRRDDIETVIEQGVAL